jgi:hypothetical protein
MPSRITCITKPHPQSPLEHITNVGGTRASGTSFYITREECARDIDNRREPYYVQVGRDTVAVETYTMHGQRFIKTKPDQTQKDNLLSLPPCRG